MLALLISSFAHLNTFLARPISPTLYPFSWIPTLHALRVSLAFRALCRANRRAGEEGGRGGRGIRGGGEEVRVEPRAAWAQDLAGFLVMVSGSSTARV